MVSVRTATDFSWTFESTFEVSLYLETGPGALDLWMGVRIAFFQSFGNSLALRDELTTFHWHLEKRTVFSNEWSQASCWGSSSSFKWSVSVGFLPLGETCCTSIASAGPSLCTLMETALWQFFCLILQPTLIYVKSGITEVLLQLNKQSFHLKHVHCFCPSGEIIPNHCCFCCVQVHIPTGGCCFFWMDQLYIPTSLLVFCLLSFPL